LRLDLLRKLEESVPQPGNWQAKFQRLLYPQIVSAQAGFTKQGNQLAGKIR
jgi:hypothetical protein